MSWLVHTGFCCHRTGWLPGAGLMSTSPSVGSASAQAGVLQVCLALGVDMTELELTTESSRGGCLWGPI